MDLDIENRISKSRKKKKKDILKKSLKHIFERLQKYTLINSYIEK